MTGRRAGRLTGRGLLFAVAAATAVALAAGSVAYAADRATSSPGSTNANTTKSSTTKPAPPKPGASPRRPGPLPRAPWGGPFGGAGFGAGPRFGGGLLGGLVLHGRAVVRKAGGGYETVATQQGRVLAVTSSSITIKSADGYTTTYAVTSRTLVDAARDGIGTVKTGHTVLVLATVASGGTATAVRIDDVTVERSAGRAWSPGPPAPAATAGASVAA